MPEITNWLMVIITAIYVIATIAIWIANNKSAKLTEEQLEETKLQFEETKRLECMPFLQIELCAPETASFVSDIPLYTEAPETETMEIVKLRNLGNGTAINLIYSWECKAVNKSEIDCMPICAIQKEDSYFWQINFQIDDTLPVTFKGDLCLIYNDLLGNTYEQSAILSFALEDGELSIEKCEMDVPAFKGVLAYKLADNKNESTNKSKG